ncbi:nicotinamide riboside kinase 2-like isoform X1 [Sander lucioperca]|uniref:Nicotinamide riboside kinase 2-like n=1 Tax=Sander lucioperca TaxID=283035 RepID=A0A8D0A7H6_SANLU|nr:nicotinamide riboside kinase 2-like isoform X1 [Sander lucioperca]
MLQIQYIDKRRYKQLHNYAPFSLVWLKTCIIIDGLVHLLSRPLLEVFDKSYYITVSYEECKRRRSTRQYTVPDPPGLFDGHVWPMSLKHRREMESSGLNIECLDGLKSKDEIYNQVYEDIQNNLLNRL